MDVSANEYIVVWYSNILYKLKISLLFLLLVEMNIELVVYLSTVYISLEQISWLINEK